MTGEPPQGVHDVLRSLGQPLDPATRTFIEPRFGRDFSSVMVHTDAKAAESARALNAQAYTIGRDVIFGASQYSPSTYAGRQLLAHEMAHVVQKYAACPALQKQENPQTQIAKAPFNVAIVLEEDEKLKNEAAALTPSVLNVVSLRDITIQLRSIRKSIGTIYVISHSNRTGQLRIMSKIGTISWIKIGELSDAIHAALPGAKAPKQVDFRGCNLGEATDNLSTFRSKVGAGAVQAYNCFAFSKSTEAVYLGTMPITTEKQLSDVKLKKHFQLGLRNLVSMLRANNKIPVSDCIEGLKPGERAAQNLPKIRKIYFASGGTLVAQWVSPRNNENWQTGSTCVKDLTPTTNPCKLVIDQVPPTHPQQAIPPKKSEVPEGESTIRLAEDIQIQRQVDPEKDEEWEASQTKRFGKQSSQIDAKLTNQDHSLRGGGQPLPLSVRSFFEPRFGYDLSNVRVHTDVQAEESARSVNASAYTVGRDVVFGSRQYAPERFEGRRLLAHELTHVIQQGNATEYGRQINNSEKKETGVSNFMITNCKSRNQPVKVGSVLTGTIQRGWPVIVAWAAAAGAGGYGLWGKSCLEKCRKPMFEKTFGAYSPEGTGGFRLWYYNQTHSPVPGKVWDSFGHCFVACCGTKECGAFTAAIAGKGREFWREYLDSNPHDSYAQDTNNQTLGRSYGAKGMDCEIACRSASLSGDLDLSAPVTEYWTPTKKRYLAPIAALAPILKSDADIIHWINENKLRDISTISVNEKIRMINRLLDGWISKEDMDAIEKICSSINTEGEMRAIEREIGPRATELQGFGQRMQLRIAIGRRL